jgi:hypothetical protein
LSQVVEAPPCVPGCRRLHGAGPSSQGGGVIRSCRSYHPATAHTVAWVAVLDGALLTPARIDSAEIAIFEPSEDSIDFVAEGNTRFVIGSAAPHPHDLFLGNYSVHTSARALREGEAEIRSIGRKLRAEGKRSYALREY